MKGRQRISESGRRELTTMTQPAGDQVRRAVATSVCAAEGCFELIWAGTPIIKGATGGWRHLDCRHPGKWHGRRLGKAAGKDGR
jgi:hypothetical protein